MFITGFDRFGPAKTVNPSSEFVLPAVKHAYPDLVETRVLPTVFGEASEIIVSTLEQIDPAAIILFGVAPGRQVKIERFARNWRLNLLIADNAGSRGFGRIRRGEAGKLSSTLPINELYSDLQGSLDAPVKLSADAGSFVCNATMYDTLANARARDIPAGFIHVGDQLDRQTVEQAAVAAVQVVGRSVGLI